MKRVKLMKGNNLDLLKELPANSIDSIVTDPPYGLSFMNKKWDYDVPSVEFWQEVYRVLKPGGHVLSFGGTRTYHRMVVNMEDAGFEIRDQIMWIYGSGFPKSYNIGKSIQNLKENGSSSNNGSGDSSNGSLGYTKLIVEQGARPRECRKYNIKMNIDNEWKGWGTALKPANEPICLARKPLSEKSVAENVLKWKTGGINVDGCRVGSEIIETNMKNTSGGLYNLGNEKRTNEVQNTFNEGRFPANIILECCCDEVIEGEKGHKKTRHKLNDHYENSIFGIGGFGIENYDYNDKGDIHTNPECPCYIMDEQSGNLKSTGSIRKKDTETDATSIDYKHKTGENSNPYAGQSGGASRFFYQAKVSKKERNLGLDAFEDKERHMNLSSVVSDSKSSTKNNHPTVKPVNLLTYLCRMITPPKGIVLDPFMGSGSTGIAAQLEGFRFCGMEMDEDYFKIAEARIENYEKYKSIIK